MKCIWIALLGLISTMVHGQVQLNPCIENHDFKIVILGSSTAAGSGASMSHNAWVNRYRSALQTINPNNEVINLAQGGYTTYRLMPNNFVTPANRPPIDTNKNITAALKHNPDAIIINLPSNDRQWPMTEQLDNFDSLYNHSWNSGVPLFVCTTQPIQPVNWAAYQRSVRDSILNRYGPFAIEFFLPLADTNNVINPQYAADAVHLNDAGHAILFNQAWQADVLAKVFQPRSIPDLAAKDLLLPNSKCTDSTMMVGLVIANLGDTAQPGALGWLSASGPIQDSISVSFSNPLMPCTIDTIWTQLNTGLAGQYSIDFNIDYQADTILDNNLISEVFVASSNPLLVVQDDTLCEGQLTQFNAGLMQGDTVLWYRSLTDTIPVQAGTGFNLLTDTTLFAQGVSGPLYYANELLTTNDWDINFNGNMFDLVAKKDITLESFRIRSHSTGQVPVNVYVKSGTYRGFEQNSSSWSLLWQDTLSVINAGDSIFLDFPDTALVSGDTLGIYVHMATSSQRLLYRRSSQPTQYSTDELQYLSGSGMGFNFGTDYPNRIINARFYYRHGTNLLGDCAGTRVAVSRIIAPSLDLGPDTVGPISGVLLQVRNGFSNVSWITMHNGDTVSQSGSVFIDSTLLIPGQIFTDILCSATDKFGCQTEDTIRVTLLNSFGFDEYQFESIKLYPNPTDFNLHIETTQSFDRVEVMDLSGRVMKQRNVEEQTSYRLDVSDIKTGVYILRISTPSGTIARQFIKY